MPDNRAHDGESATRPLPTAEAPTIELLQEWELEGGCESTDGCWVEPDGTCEHGHPSWLVWLGLI